MCNILIDNNMKKVYLLFQLLFLLLIGITLTNCEKDVDPISVTSVTLDSTSITLIEGDKQTLTATISPSNAENQMVLWISSDASVATVKNGTITAIKPGKATITAKSDDGGKTATCNVTVVARVYSVEKVALDITSATFYEGEDLTLTATISPSNATNKNVTWKSSNTSVATVSNGNVTAVKAGTATITVTTEEGGKTATCNVTVNEKIYPVENVSLDKTSAILFEGETLTLSATITPGNATNKNVTWKSSDTSVAMVADGKVTALKAGTTTITVTTEDGNKTATCDVMVNAKVTSVSLDKTEVELTEGDTHILTATINPDNATNKNVIWSSSNASVATVSNGKVTAVKAGTATITVTTEDGGKTATCRVMVNEKIYPVDGLSLNKSIAVLYEGETLTLTATITPSNATNKNVIWSSNNTSVATVANGVVTALNAGTAIITATTEDGGKTATCEIIVKTKVTGVSLDKSDATLYEGENLSLIATIVPDNATNKNVAWKSSNTSVATVVDGVVSALKAGVATITVTTEDGGKTATCNVTVKAKVASVSLNKSEASLYEGETVSLIATITPSNATNKNVIWSSSDTSVATVLNGKVTALKAGTTSITVTTEDGGKTATCNVTVKAKVVGVSLNRTAVTLYEGESFTLIATITPENATNKNVIWSSSNTSVATVANGEITALEVGSATITVTTEDGGKMATCTVTVNEKIYPVEGVSLNQSTATLYEGESLSLTATITPSNATNKNVTWKSSNTSVATVVDGVVTAVKAGTATITATTEDGGKMATCNITVNAKVASISLDKTEVSLTEGDTTTLTASISPSNAVNKNVTWSSSNPTVATVSNGKVTALKAGTATITVTTEDGGKMATCTVTVKAKVYPVTRVSLNKSSITLKDGETFTLVATITPSNATNKKVQWYSMDPSIATVSNGKVTAIKSGSTYIQVITEDGNKTAFCEVTVYNPVTGVSLEQTSTTLSVGDKSKLTAVVTPNNASNKNVTWSSSNTNVVVVNDGEIEALTIGSATITVTTEDGGFVATCTVSVKHINSNDSELDLTPGSGNI